MKNTTPSLRTIWSLLTATACLAFSQTVLAQANDEGLALIPEGNFQMGDSFSEGATWERPVHSVNISNFYMAKNETTTELWDSVRAWGLNNGYTDLPVANGSLASKGANHPVHLVSWYDAVKWCNARSQMEGLTPCYKVGVVDFKTGTDSGVTCSFEANGYRLPTEAEWEKAARGGLSGKRFPWGNTINHSNANYYANGSTFSYDTSGFSSFTYHPDYDSGDQPYSSPVGSFAPNGYGLNDMAGNMWEWCWDWHESTYDNSSPSTDPRGPTSGTVRVYRGGGWNYGAIYGRVAARGISNPGNSSNGFGFRVARSAVGTQLLADTTSLAFGNVKIGVAVAKTVTVRNAGNSNLTGLAVTRSGTHAPDFVMGALGSTSLAPGASTTFKVTFSPSAAGTRTAALQIASNNSNENAFRIALGGSGVVVTSAPEIVVQQPVGTNLVDGNATLTFGERKIGASSAKTITIRNSGTAKLTGLAVTRRGTNASDYVLGALGSTSLAPGASTTFKVTFEPSAKGKRTATLLIANNDANENPFHIALEGSGVGPVASAPEIVVEHPVATILVDGTANLNFGRSMMNAFVDKTITVRNKGTANLTGLAVSRSGSHASDFVMGALGSTMLKPGESTTFKVTFTPSARGTRSGALQITSNDANENPFDIQLVGTGSGAPEIVVHQGKGPKKNLKDNRSTRNFDEIKVGSASKPMVFTIKNKGKARLKKLRVTFRGKQAEDFKVVKKPAKSVAPGKSTRFKVIYKPLAERSSITKMRIRSNDKDENPFRVKLKGTGAN